MSEIARLLRAWRDRLAQHVEDRATDAYAADHDEIEGRIIELETVIAEAARAAAPTDPTTEDRP